jgi:NADH dehydrogenase/NADH:ubiquinone oxidoreductase subunit G
MTKIRLTIDGRECLAERGQTIWEAAKENGIYIPTLCHLEGLKPVGCCRVCTVKIRGKFQAACTQPAVDGMVVENKTAQLEDMRKALIEMLFVEGNHLCPSCEKSGNCELQALAYRYRIMSPRFPYQYAARSVNASSRKIIFDHNRCIQCLRCVRGVKAADGRNVFGLVHRGKNTRIGMDPRLAYSLSDEEAHRAMDICPVGTILKREVGFVVPIGKRRFDRSPIGSEIEGPKIKTPS